MGKTFISIRTSCTDHVGGSARFDTRVMQRLGERVFCKVGAEGVYCAALPDQGLGVAIKMDDGNTARAAEAAMAMPTMWPVFTSG